MKLRTQPLASENLKKPRKLITSTRVTDAMVNHEKDKVMRRQNRSAQSPVTVAEALISPKRGVM